MGRRTFSIGDELLLRTMRKKIILKENLLCKVYFGEGASCITYFVKYKENDSYSHCGVLKEFNPISEDISMDKFVEGYKLQSEFSAEIKNAKNITSNTEGLYSGNNTKYILMSCNDGTVMKNIQEDNLQDIIKTTIAICNAIKVYHDAGFLHLDIKPDNIFILPETREIIKLFDFDSVH
jgi:serine/threonine protein kinase